MTLNKTMQLLSDDENFINYIKEYYFSIYVKKSNGFEEVVNKTNIKFVHPTTYFIGKEEILYYGNNTGSSRNYYLPSINKEFSFKELKEYLKGQ